MKPETVDRHPSLRRTRNRRRDALIGVGIAILLLLLAEVGARGYFWLENRHLGRREYGFYPGGYGDLMPGQDGIWTLWAHRPYRVQTNAVGLRNLKPPSAGESLRILAVGDSFTFGPFVPNEDTLPGWLQTILRQRLNRSDVEVLNAGIMGYTVEDELSYFRDKGQALAPDIVILQFHPNDISDFQAIKRQQLRRPAQTIQQSGIAASRFLNDHVALYRLAVQVKTRVLRRVKFVQAREADIMQITGEHPYSKHLDIVYAHPDLPEYRSYYEQYENFLRDLIETVRAAGGQLVIVAFPEYWQLPPDAYPDHPQKFVQAIAADTGTPYLDLLPTFRAAGEIEDLYLVAYDVEVAADSDDPFFAERTRYVGNGHLSRFGYRVAARAVADFLFAGQIGLQKSSRLPKSECQEH